MLYSYFTQCFIKRNILRVDTEYTVFISSDCILYVDTLLHLLSFVEDPFKMIIHVSSFLKYSF